MTRASSRNIKIDRGSKAMLGKLKGLKWSRTLVSRKQEVIGKWGITF